MFKFIGKYSGPDEQYEGTLVIPMRCAICDSEDAELFSYQQGHFPLVVPMLIVFVGVHRETTATIPYCDRHLAAFHSRFRILSFVQYSIIAISVALSWWGWFLQEHHNGGEGWNWQIVTSMFCFFFVLPASLFIRGYLYDAFYRVRPEGVEIKSNHRQFIRNLYEANCIPIDEAAFGQGLGTT